MAAALGGQLAQDTFDNNLQGHFFYLAPEWETEEVCKSVRERCERRKEERQGRTNNWHIGE
jgi:hypothetical protein